MEVIKMSLGGYNKEEIYYRTIKDAVIAYENLIHGAVKVGYEIVKGKSYQVLEEERYVPTVKFELVTVLTQKDIEELPEVEKQEKRESES